MSLAFSSASRSLEDEALILSSEIASSVSFFMEDSFDFASESSFLSFSFGSSCFERLLDEVVSDFDMLSTAFAALPFKASTVLFFDDAFHTHTRTMMIAAADKAAAAAIFTRFFPVV